MAQMNIESLGDGLPRNIYGRRGYTQKACFTEMSSLKTNGIAEFMKYKWLVLELQFLNWF